MFFFKQEEKVLVVFPEKKKSEHPNKTLSNRYLEKEGNQGEFPHKKQGHKIIGKK